MAGRAPWRVLGCSVRGVSHERAGLPNQDALAWTPRDPAGLPLALAVADGHGSPRCFRSDLGARLAVDSALAALFALAEMLGPVSQDAAPSPDAAETLARTVADRWNAAVDADLAARPLTAAELETLAAAQGEAARAALEAHPRLAYGTTLLAVLIAESFLLYFQLGDGDILAVADDGQVSRPVPRDPRLFANETTSLSGPEAWRDARVVVQVAAGPSPALILLSTDGYANAFRDDQEFCQVGPDLLALLRAEGLDQVAALLPDWLAEASREGSGDDVTLGILCRTGALLAAASPTTAVDSIGQPAADAAAGV
jgi:serine/threonine protein phosphatase PrpC